MVTVLMISIYLLTLSIIVIYIHKQILRSLNHVHILYATMLFIIKYHIDLHSLS